MTILENLYSIVETAIDSDSSVEFTVRLNADNVIFKAHFPNEPILPGACITQMVLELYEHWTHHDADIRKIGNLKFLSAISPSEVTELKVRIEQTDANSQQAHIKASITHGDICHAKMSVEIIHI